MVSRVQAEKSEFMYRQHLKRRLSLFALALAVLATSGCTQWPFARDAKKNEPPPSWAPREMMKGATGIDQRARDIERNLGLMP